MDWNSNRRRHIYKRGTFRRRKNLLLSCSKMTILQIDVVSINNPCAQSHTLFQNFEQGVPTWSLSSDDYSWAVRDESGRGGCRGLSDRVPSLPWQGSKILGAATCENLLY